MGFEMAVSHCPLLYMHGAVNFLIRKIKKAGFEPVSFWMEVQPSAARPNNNSYFSCICLTLVGIGSTLSCLEEERARRILFISIMVVGHFFCGERKFMSNASDRIYLFSRPRSLQLPFLSLGKTFLLFLFSKNYLYELKKQRKKSINKLSSVWLL